MECRRGRWHCRAVVEATTWFDRRDAAARRAHLVVSVVLAARGEVVSTTRTPHVEVTSSVIMLVTVVIVVVVVAAAGTTEPSPAVSVEPLHREARRPVRQSRPSATTKPAGSVVVRRTGWMLVVVDGAVAGRPGVASVSTASIVTSSAATV